MTSPWFGCECTPELSLQRAYTECECGHPRLRHCGCDNGAHPHHPGWPHWECCDEDDCACTEFTPSTGDSE